MRISAHVPMPPAAMGSYAVVPAGPGAVGPAPSTAPPTVEVRPVPATRYAPPVTVDVQGCMEKALQGGSYDRMSPRDPRKRLVRLQARQACEERPGVPRASPAGADGIPIEPDAPVVAGR